MENGTPNSLPWDEDKIGLCQQCIIINLFKGIWQSWYISLSICIGTYERNKVIFLKKNAWLHLPIVLGCSKRLQVAVIQNLIQIDPFTVVEQGIRIEFSGACCEKFSMSEILLMVIFCNISLRKHIGTRRKLNWAYLMIHGTSSLIRFFRNFLANDKEPS